MFEDTPAVYAPPALAARLGIKIIRVSLSKVPFVGTHGHLDATSDPKTIAEMARAHQRGLWAMATGKPSGRVVIDIDRKVLTDGTVVWGLDSLDAEGIVYWSLHGPTTHTPRGGFQQWCEDPGCYMKSGGLVIDGRKIAGVDIKGDGGFVCLPPGPGRFWDAYLGPDTPPAPLPGWAIMPVVPHHERSAGSEPPRDGDPLSAYCEAILRNACREIESATSDKHNARYCGLNGMPEALARFELEQAALTFDEGRQSEKRVLETGRSAFAAGKAAPHAKKESAAR